MDPITHAASGAVLALTLPQKPATKWFVPLAALVAASPDIDIIFAPLPVDFLLLHRGITHSLAAVPFMALLLAFCMYPLWNKKTPHAFSYGKTVFFASILLLLHIWLDVITTYGTLVFLPFSEYRVRLNGVFIIDFLVTLPLLTAIYLGTKQRKWAVMALIWICIYPSACVFLRYHLEHITLEKLQASGQEVTQITVLPDALAPLNWRVIYTTNQPYAPKAHMHQNSPDNLLIGQNLKGFHFPPSEHTVWHQGIDFFGKPHTKAYNYPALPKALAQNLSEQSTRALAFLRFSLMPIFEKRSLESNSEEVAIYDLRFGSMLTWVKKIMDKRNDGQPTFLFLGEKEQQQWTAVRMVFSGSGLDSGWQPPTPPKTRTWWQWLFGAAPKPLYSHE